MCGVVQATMSLQHEGGICSMRNSRGRGRSIKELFEAEEEG